MIGVSVGSIIWFFLFGNTDWPEVFGAIRSANLACLLLAQISAWSTHFVRIKRWSYIVRASQAAKFRNLLSSTQIGFLVNFTIPARVGELVRSAILSKLENVPFTKSLSMVALDRISDMLGLMPVLLFVSVLLPSQLDWRIPAEVLGNNEPIVLSTDLLHYAAILSALALVGCIGLLWLMYINSTIGLRILEYLSRPLPLNAGSWIKRQFTHFISGIRVFGSTGALMKIFLLSILIWGLSALSLAAIMAAFSISYSLTAPFVMLVMIALFISFPVVPAAVGQYHLAVIASLMLTCPDTDIEIMKAMGIVSHIWALIPIYVLGIFCLIHSNINFFNIFRMSEVASPHDDGISGNADG